MVNERLRAAMGAAGITADQLAADVRVDPKTVDRWIRGGRTPHRSHRYAVASRLDRAVHELWPDAGANGGSRPDEIVSVYAHRAALTGPMWRTFIEGAQRNLDLLAYAGLFLPEQTFRLPQLLASLAQRGVAIRILLGDPDCEAVRLRGDEEGIGDAVAIKVRNSLDLYRPVAGCQGIDVRVHATTLYTSVYRVDDEMIANPHVLGLPGAQSPALHLRRTDDGDLFATYAATFERVWEGARPAWT